MAYLIGSRRPPPRKKPSVVNFFSPVKKASPKKRPPTRADCAPVVAGVPLTTQLDLFKVVLMSIYDGVEDWETAKKAFRSTDTRDTGMMGTTTVRTPHPRITIRLIPGTGVVFRVRVS